MKKALSIFLAMLLILTLAAGCLAEAAPAGGRGFVVGALSLLNLTEEEYRAVGELLIMQIITVTQNLSHKDILAPDFERNLWFML